MLHRFSRRSMEADIASPQQLNTKQGCTGIKKLCGGGGRELGNSEKIGYCVPQVGTLGELKGQKIFYRKKLSVPSYS